MVKPCYEGGRYQIEKTTPWLSIYRIYAIQCPIVILL